MQDAVTPLSPRSRPEKATVYSSQPMQERRRRLLREARHMIAESGYDNFSVRKLCVTADVAQRTLYNAFESKDRLIALAIVEAYHDFHRYIRYQTDRNSLAGVLDRAISASRSNLRAPNYVRAVTAIFFGSRTPRDIWEALRDISLNRTREWLESMKRSGDLQPWVNEDHFGDAMANLQYSTINDWCLGRLNDEEYLLRLTENMLLLIIGAVRGNVRDEADRYLVDIRRNRRLPSFPKAIGVPRDSVQEPGEGG